MLFIFLIILVGQPVLVKGEYLQSSPLVIAHRGASAHFPENTLPSYEGGFKAKADYLEIDLQMTKDGHLVTIHDETVDGTTNGKGRVNEFTLEELRKLDAGYWFNERFKGTQIPTLDEVFKRFGNKTKYYIEVKKPKYNKDMERKLLDVIRSNNIKPENLIIQSFNVNSLERIHQVEPKIKLVMLYWKKDFIPLEDLAELSRYAFAVGMNHDRVTSEMVQEVHNHGLQLHVFTANKDEEIIRVIDLGVDGVFSDDPRKVRSILTRHY
jgi:glycerophosphoryl diester phosphodiesterase